MVPYLRWYSVDVSPRNSQEITSCQLCCLCFPVLLVFVVFIVVCSCLIFISFLVGFHSVLKISCSYVR